MVIVNRNRKWTNENDGFKMTALERTPRDRYLIVRHIALAALCEISLYLFNPRLDPQAIFFTKQVASDLLWY